MNYIELINTFWQKDIEYCFSEKATALYFYLLNISNMTGWKNPFGQSNAAIIAKFGWGKTSFDTAKNDLKKAGLIDFKPGDGRGIVYQYELKVIKKVDRKIPLSVHLSNSLSDTLSKQKPDTSINVNQTKHSKSHSVANAPAPKKTESIEKTEYWKKIVEAWFDFYGKRFKKEDNSAAKPIFNKIQGEHLKKIAGHLKKISLDANREWKEEYAVYCLRGFFQKGYDHDEWMKTNFELGNLLSKFNSITNSTANGRQEKQNNQPRGAIVGEGAREYGQL